MKKRLTIASCMLLATPLLMGIGPIVADNADLLRVQGKNEVTLVNGTLISQQSENGDWTALFSRNKGSLKIEVSAPAGTYYVETWSIAADPMYPERIHQSKEIVIGDGDGPPSPPFTADDLVALIAAWGPCTGSCPYDFDGNGVVNIFDLLYLVLHLGLD